MLTRNIPSSGEALPMIGVGTYRGFDVAPGSYEYKLLPRVLDELLQAGGTVIDSSVPVTFNTDDDFGPFPLSKSEMLDPYYSSSLDIYDEGPPVSPHPEEMHVSPWELDAAAASSASSSSSDLPGPSSLSRNNSSSRSSFLPSYAQYLVGSTGDSGATSLDDLDFEDT